MGKSYSVLTLAAAGGALAVLLHWVFVQPAALAGDVPATFFLAPVVGTFDDASGVAQGFRLAFLWMSVATGTLSAGLRLAGASA